MEFRYGDIATEYYEVFVGENLDELILVGSDDDQSNHDFYTQHWKSSWCYIILVRKTGNIDGDDLTYSPKIDAVRFEV